MFADVAQQFEGQATTLHGRFGAPRSQILHGQRILGASGWLTTLKPHCMSVEERDYNLGGDITKVDTHAAICFWR